jgi:crotonobetainyl-CoA:carnitine CoA-transferase CaiB-like acyl-CoA transferase
MRAATGADGATPQLGCPIKMTGFEPSPPRPAPRAGEHTDEILRQAGLDAPAVAVLRAAGAVD